MTTLRSVLTFRPSISTPQNLHNVHCIEFTLKETIISTYSEVSMAVFVAMYTKHLCKSAILCVEPCSTMSTSLLDS